SPNHYGQWTHAKAPVASPAGRVELWHTRLGVRTASGQIDESSGAAPLRTARALWAREHDFSPGHPCNFVVASDSSMFAGPMTTNDRIVIVHQSSNFAPATCPDPQNNPFPGPPASVGPEPIRINRMMLTNLGGYLDSRGDWGSDPLYGIE